VKKSVRKKSEGDFVLLGERKRKLFKGKGRVDRSERDDSGIPIPHSPEAGQKRDQHSGRNAGKVGSQITPERGRPKHKE